MIALRADDEIDETGARKKFLALGLSDAAGNREQRPALAGGADAVLQMPEPSQFRIDLLRRLLADVAGVEDDQVGVRRVVHRHIPAVRQNIRHRAES